MCLESSLALSLIRAVRAGKLWQFATFVAVVQPQRALMLIHPATLVTWKHQFPRSYDQLKNISFLL